MNRKNKHIMIDYTMVEFPSLLSGLRNDPMDIIKGWIELEIGGNPTMAQLENAMNKYGKKWNDLPLEEKNGLLDSADSSLLEPTFIFWEKNFLAISLHKRIFSDPFAEWYPINPKMIKDYEEFFVRYKTMAVKWCEFFLSNIEEFKRMLTGGTTRNTIAAFISLFTEVSIGIEVESYLNMIRTILIQGKEMDDKLFWLIPNLLENIVVKEVKASEDFLSETSGMEYDELADEVDSPSHYSYRYISTTPHLSALANQINSSNVLVKELAQDFMKDNELNYKFSHFLFEAAEVRGSNREGISKIQNGVISLSGNSIARELDKGYGDFLRERIKHVRNITLRFKDCIKDMFINGSDKELQYVADWYFANMDKSIMAGILISRDIFDKKDLEMIIEAAIRATIYHNGDLLTLAGSKLVDWLVLGLRE